MIRIGKDLFAILMLVATLGVALQPDQHSSKNSLEPPQLTPRKVKFNIQKMPGISAPLYFFDPLKLSEGRGVLTMKRWMEAEIKHGRVAMLACTGILMQESALFRHLGFDHGAPAFNQFHMIEKAAPPFWFIAILCVGTLESISISKGWQTSSRLLEVYIPGDLGFDPLHMNPMHPCKTFLGMTVDFRRQRTRELQHGRLAMLAIMIIFTQELITGHPVLE
jgi:Chlorophyll A-B binding protein